MMKDERICKRPSTKAKRQKVTDARVLEALEREAGMGIKHPDHLKKIKDALKGAKG